MRYLNIGKTKTTIFTEKLQVLTIKKSLTKPLQIAMETVFVTSKRFKDVLILKPAISTRILQKKYHVSFLFRIVLSAM
jgi:hypothetical protein